MARNRNTNRSTSSEAEKSTEDTKTGEANSADAEQSKELETPSLGLGEDEEAGGEGLETGEEKEAAGGERPKGGDSEDGEAGKETDSAEPNAAKDEDGIPYCSVHHCRMKASSGPNKNSPNKSHYKCPIRKCDEKGERIKKGPKGIVPAQPQQCPRCSTPKKPVYCQRDTTVSTAASVILKCPDCNWKSNALAVPQLAAAHLASRGRAPVEELGRR